MTPSDFDNFSLGVSPWPLVSNFNSSFGTSSVMQVCWAVKGGEVPGPRGGDGDTCAEASVAKTEETAIAVVIAVDVGEFFMTRSSTCSMKNNRLELRCSAHWSWHLGPIPPDRLSDESMLTIARVIPLFERNRF